VSGRVYVVAMHGGHGINWKLLPGRVCVKGNMSVIAVLNECMSARRNVLLLHVECAGLSIAYGRQCGVTISEAKSE
jgi:hypothetical protein